MKKSNKMKKLMAELAKAKSKSKSKSKPKAKAKAKPKKQNLIEKVKKVIKRRKK